MFASLIGWRQASARLSTEFNEVFRSLKNQQFSLYCTGQIISVCGTWMQSITLSWLVYKLTQSALMLGVVSFASAAPLLLLSLPAGALADKLNRKKIIITTQWLALLQAVILGTITLLGILSVSYVITLAVFLGICTAIELPARQAFVSEIVTEKELLNAISLNSAIQNIARMIGPLLAAVVVGWAGEGTCFIVNAISYIAALVTLRKVQIIRKHSRPKENKQHTTAQVIRVVKASGVMNLLIMTVFLSMFGFQFSVLLPVVADKLLHGQHNYFAALTSAMGIGALAGSLALARKGTEKKLRTALGISTLGLATAILILAYSHSVIISCLAVAAAGYCISTQFVGGNSTVQTSVPENVKGRVLGIYNLCMLGMAPFGSLVAGWSAEKMGVSTALLITSIICALSALWYLTRLHKQADQTSQ